MLTTRTLAGQAVLVTGGASGIGLAIVKAFADAGSRIALADLNADAAEREVERLRGQGCEAIAIRVDVADSGQVQDMVDRTVAEFGGLDVLVHSAGIGVERPFLETTDAEWQRIIDIDLNGTFYCMRAAGRVMAASGYGRIVVLASTAGLRGGTGRAAYGASKGGVISLTKVLAVELAQDGVTVNALAPGAIETELVRKMHSPETRENYRRAIPMDRYGEPEEVAHAALYLASPGASYVTGHILAVDGGFIAAGVLSKRQAS